MTDGAIESPFAVLASMSEGQLECARMHLVLRHELSGALEAIDWIDSELLRRDVSRYKRETLYKTKLANLPNEAQ